MKVPERFSKMENDTLKLLKECNSGVKMGESAFKKVLPHVKNEELKKALTLGKSSHDAIGAELHDRLCSLGESTKTSHPLAQAMSEVKVAAKMLNPSDKTIAGIMTDGCDMGIKFVNGYLNEYKKADSDSKDIAKRLIASEEFLERKLRPYL